MVPTDQDGPHLAGRGQRHVVRLAWRYGPGGARLGHGLPQAGVQYVIDTGLLAAGATLWATLSLNPLVHLWLGAKLCLLLVYVVLGSMALKRARTRVVQQTCLVAALASVAYMHDPLGLLLPWVSHGG